MNSSATIQPGAGGAPEYRARHIFATKLRLAAFVAFWAIYLFFLRDVLWQTKGVALVVTASFLLTGLAYHNILSGRWLVGSFAIEIASDLIAITAVVYLTGGPHSPYYTIYLFYAFIAGALYSYRLAAIVAAAAVACYAAFLILCHLGIIGPLILDYGDAIPIPAYTPLAHFIFAAIFLAGIVYTAKVAGFFSQRRERALERRNRELTALQRMCLTVRSTELLRDVIEDLLDAIISGLGFRTAALVRFDWPARRGVLYPSRRTPRFSEIEWAVGFKLDGAEFDLARLPAVAIQEVKRQRIIFRRGLSELVSSGSESGAALLARVQEMAGARRIAVMPIVAEGEALGAILGLSAEPFIEEEQVATMEAFANQSALSFEAATLIDRLGRVNEELKEANRVKSEFLATMSHELRTPLTAIIGFSELLMEGVMGEPTEEQRDGLSEVLHNAADLLELINSLLDLTKIESGKMGIEIEPFDLAGTVRRAIGTTSLLIQRKGQELNVEIPEGLGPFVGDERKIGQLVLNLLANANKFTPDGGHIALKVRAFRSWDEIRSKAGWWRRVEGLSAAFGAGGIEITVSDDGIGIAPDQLEAVFEMFLQADVGAARSYGGTGVGLAIARKFVEMHGGRIWAESEPGKGARFTAALPIREG